MKRLLFMSALFFLSFLVKTADAQVNLSVNLNVGNQPMWGPAGYNYVEYYFLPDIDVYYHVNSRMYTYYNGRKWINVRSLPGKYRHYDLYRGHKVVVNHKNPWNRHSYYSNHYASYRGGHSKQVLIRDNRRRYDYGDRRYNVNHGKKHNDYKKYHKDRDDRYDRGRNNGRGGHGNSHKGRD